MTRIIFLIILLSVLVFNFCKHQPEEEWLPDINFLKGNAYIYSDSTIEAGNLVKIGLQAEANKNSGNLLKSIIITCFTDGSGVIILDTIVSLQKFEFEIDILPEEQGGTIKYLFSVVDEKGIRNESEIEIEFFTLAPEISLVSGTDFVSGDITIQQNKFFRIGIEAISSEYTQGKLKQLIIRRKYGSLFITEIDSALSDLTSFSGEWYFTSNPLATTEEWWFIVKDEFERVGVKTINILTNAPQTPMNLHFTESVYNGLGANNYGWDLLNDEPLYWSSLPKDRDLVNDTAYVYLIEPFFFKLMLKSENNTRFVKANYFDFENAPYEDAVDIFTGATISNVKTYITNFTEEDIFIAKLRNMEEYVAVKITNIEQTVGDNSDRIDFEYKKMGE
ncbi:MAG: hypothetical protein JXR58_00925 [Bacteroidales bacterium]|nr:hypothetical protein [Bacteroidales bacterium]